MAEANRLIKVTNLQNVYGVNFINIFGEGLSLYFEQTIIEDIREDNKSIKKGVPCSDPKLLCQLLQKSQQAASSSQSTLEANCLSVGLELHGETPADGNCLFEAVSSQLRRLNRVVQKSPQQLRQEVVAFMRANRVLPASEGTIHLDSFIYNESFDVYCSRMAMDSQWADHVVVVAMARMLQIDIMIVTSSPSSGRENIIVWVVGKTAFQEDPILLGHVWESHYMSLQPIEKLHETVLNRSRPNLMKFLNVGVVMNYIQQQKLFDDASIRDIKKQRTATKAISLLIDQLKQRDQDTYEKFKKCLIQANRADLKTKLEKEEENVAAEMKEKHQGTDKLHQTVLNRCRSKLIKDLNVEVVMMYIQEKELLDDVTIRDINEQPTTTKKISHLLDQIKLGDKGTYEGFKECLILAKQADLKIMLEEEDNLAAQMK